MLIESLLLHASACDDEGGVAVAKQITTGEMNGSLTTSIIINKDRH